MDQTPADLESIARLFLNHGVEFIVVGGQAEWLFGSRRATFDVDLCYRKTAQNLERLVAALRTIHPTLRNAPPDLPFQLDPKSIAMGDNFTFRTDLGDLDLLGFLEPIGGYDELIQRAEVYELEGRNVYAISLDDLIRIKQHISRPKDRDSLLHLLEIKKVREQQGEK